MIPEFDLEKELDLDLARQVTEEFLRSDVGGFVEQVLGEMGINTALKAYHRGTTDAIKTRQLQVTKIDIVKPTMEYLRELPNKYFGRQVRLIFKGGYYLPYSLARDGDDIYIRCHVSPEDTVEQTIKEK